MAKITLLFEGQKMREFGVGRALTIGRLPDNVVVIDNASISGHHARIALDGEQYVIEDLGSTNGVFVNEQLAIRQALQDGDVIILGKHKLIFEVAGFGDGATREDTASAEPFVEQGGTAFLDTAQHRALLAKLGIPAESGAGRTEPVGDSTRPGLGVLRVLRGKADRPEYQLDAQTSIIGASPSALVRLHGWFKPTIAVSIARKNGHYLVTPLDGRALVNTKPLTADYQLNEGDVLDVGGLTLEFRVRV